MSLDIDVASKSVRRPRNAEQILTVQVNDFGDNYHHLEGEPSSELEMRVRRIRRRYKSIQEYIHAVGDYNEWMGYLRNLYGGDKLFDLYMKEGLISHYIPPIPRMKINSETKHQMKNNILPSITPKTMEVDIEGANRIAELLREKYYEENGGKPPEIEIHHSYTKEKAKWVQEGVYDEIYMDVGSKSRGYEFDVENEMDLLDKYFNRKSAEKELNSVFGKKKRKKKKKELEKARRKQGEDYTLMGYPKLRIVDYLDDSDESNIEDTQEEDTVIFINGRFYTNEEAEEIKFYEALAEYGWNAREIMRRKKYGKGIKKKKNKKAYKVWKKDEKRKKKEKKKKKKAYEGANRLVEDILLDNNYDDFEEYAEEMSNFTFENLNSCLG